MVENSFGILVKRFRVLLTIMEQRSKVVKDIVLTRVVHVEKPSGGAEEPPTPADNIQPPQRGQEEQRHHDNLRNPGGQTTMRPTERLLQSHGGSGWEEDRV